MKKKKRLVEVFSENTVNDVQITPLKQFRLDSGDVFHAMRSNEKFGLDIQEAYFSFIKKGRVKGWKSHKLMTLNLVVPVGEIAFGFIDNVGGCRVIEVGSVNYSRLTVPPGVWMAFRGQRHDKNLLLNLASHVHNPDEAEVIPYEKMPIDWKNQVLVKKSD